MGEREASRLAVATIHRPHGVRGAVVATCSADTFELLRSVEEAWVAAPDHPPRRVRLTGVGGTPAKAVLQLEGVATVEQADELRGAALELDRSVMPELSEDEYFIGDLCGCRVISAGLDIGVVRSVLQAPANDVLIVDSSEGELLVPLIKDAVPEVDVSAGQVHVDMGFLTGDRGET